ncbi:IS630 transposase-related protein, partial [Candidatus Halobeggiatoa sp. HSG11]|nr:IS630 transposase-related protein [Candidatus Halobeggiatoa sp. HSG11]
MSYSTDLRKRVVNYVTEEKNSMRSASKIFDIHYNTVKDWIKIFNKNGELSPKPILGKQPTKINLATLKKQVSEHPDWFQHEHAQTFDVTQSAISKALAKLGITCKKKH